VTIQWSSTLHGQNESRGTIALPTNKDPSSPGILQVVDVYPPNHAEPGRLNFVPNDLVAVLSPCLLQPYFNPQPNGWRFSKGMSHESSLAGGSFRLR